MREKVNIGKLAMMSGEHAYLHEIYGVGIVLRESPLYFFIKWAKGPNAPLIANRKHVRLIDESR